MFLSTPSYVIAIIVSVVVLQYAFALFCLLKLAYFDIPRNQYILWNVFILIVFFIGGGVFLYYYYTHKDKHLSKQPEIIEEKSAEEKTSDGADNKSADTEPQNAEDNVKTE